MVSQKGYGLYVGFRPDSEGWGKKAEMRLSNILELRRHLTHVDRTAANLDGGGAQDATDGTAGDEEKKTESEVEGSPAKKAKVEEKGEVDYDALLDDDLGDVDWDAVGA